MTKADFVWTVGYSGNTALVNKAMKQRWKVLEVGQLLAEGLLRAALCTALWDAEKGSPELGAGTLDSFVADFNRATGLGMGLEDIKRLLGVYRLPAPDVKVQQI